MAPYQRFLAAGFLACTLGLAAPVAAQQVINLTAIDGYPARSMWVREFVEFYIPEVDKRLAATGKYRIRWNQAWGGQIVKPGGVMEGLRTGLGDIGVITTPFKTDKIPLQALAFVTPFVTSNPVLVARTFDRLAEQFPEFKQEFTAQNQVYLANGVVLDSYQVFSKVPVRELADFKGIKVNGAGTNLRYLTNLGAVGVAGPLPTYYNNLQTGVVNAAMLWPEAAMTFKIAEVAPYMVKADLGSVNTKVLSANAETWKKLPNEVRKVLQEVASAYRERLAEVTVRDAEASLKAYEKAGGNIVTLTPEQRRTWAQGMPNIAREWAARVEGQGKPGTKILAAYMDALRAAGEKPLRNWDRE
jgi:C4-dicarboxylate-binding protein DctP